MPKTAPKWTPEQDQTAIELFKSGATLDNIATHIREKHGRNTQGGAVSERLKRLGFSRGNQPGKSYLERKIIMASFPEKVGEGITIMELREHSCRYITNDKPTLYCGHSVARGRYCLKHANLCFQSSVQTVQIDPSVSLENVSPDPV